jgi:hypothetical protein
MQKMDLAMEPKDRSGVAGQELNKNVILFIKEGVVR